MTDSAGQSARDERFMATALEISRAGRFWSSPNPHVGCLIVRDDREQGRGFTQPAGGNHAEIEALHAARESAGNVSGATAYVTLEPCAHQGRTGPCADALIEAGIARVVIGVQDPNPRVSGRGLIKLAEAGIATSIGILEAEIEEELKGFLLRMRRGWGHVRLKVAASVDGRTAMASGESQWITGSAARADVQRLRAESAAIVTGIGTVLADDCALTVRAAELPSDDSELSLATLKQPLRVVLDSRGRVPSDARILSADAPTVVFTGSDVALPVGVDTEVLVAVESGLDLQALLFRLGELGANSILIEAGATLTGAFLQAGLVDELVIYQAPQLLGASARPFTNLNFERLDQGIGLDFKEVTRIGDDLRIIATPRLRT